MYTLNCIEGFENQIEDEEEKRNEISCILNTMNVSKLQIKVKEKFK